ncbi:MAG: hypothetical protein AAFX87_19570 [Bacteroidota bacterium]
MKKTIEQFELEQLSNEKMILLKGGCDPATIDPATIDPDTDDLDEKQI